MNNILAEGLRAHNIPVPYRFSTYNGVIFPNGRTNPTKQELAEIAKAKAKEHKLQEHIQRKVTEEANSLFQSLKKADLTHHYLLKKGITEIPNNIKQIKQELVIPLQDIYGELTSLQFIDNNGKKRLLSKGRKQSCFYTIDKITDRVYSFVKEWLLVCRYIKFLKEA